MAGGEGFEPPLAESESAVLPLDEPPKLLGTRNAGLQKKAARLSFGVLGSLTSFMQANFLTFDFTGITGYVTGFAQNAA